MPKRRKEYVEIDKPIWPLEDPDIHEIVRAAFVEHYPSMMRLGIYHIMFHDKNLVRWTASVSANEFRKPTWYFQLYYNGETCVFLTRQQPPNNASYPGIEI